MQKTMVYLPWHTKARIKKAAETGGISQAEVMRVALEAGLETAESKKNASARSLLNLAELGRKHKTGKMPKTSALEEMDKMWQSWDKGNEQ